MKKLFLLSIYVILSLTSFSQDSLNMRVLFHWNDTTLPSSAGHLNRYSEIWGYAQHGKEYAIIGSTMGAHIIDITNPTLGTEVAFVKGNSVGVNIVHRDYEVYQHYLYAVCDENDPDSLSTLQIIDLQYLPDSAPVVYDRHDLMTRVHNIAIDTIHGLLYLAGSWTSQAFIFSLLDPRNPQPIIIPNYYGAGHDLYVNDSYMFNSDGVGGLKIYSISAPFNNPTLVANITNYPYKGYNHSAWVQEQEQLLVVADEDHGYKLKLFDISDLTNIELTDTFGSEVTSQSIPHNPFFKDQLIYVSYYHDGVWVFDAQDPENVQVFGYYDTSTEPNTGNYKGCWGVYPYLPSGHILASDMQNGLYVLDFIQQPSSIYSDQTSADKFTVYPNPANEYLTILPSENVDEIIIYNAFGQLVKESNSSDLLSIAGLTSGYYYLKVKDIQGNFTLHPWIKE